MAFTLSFALRGLGIFERPPTVETVGYFRQSLRDKKKRSNVTMKQACLSVILRFVICGDNLVL